MGEEGDNLRMSSSAFVALPASTGNGLHNEQAWRASLIDEARLIEGYARAWGSAYRLRAAWWQLVARNLALAGALVAAVSGGTGLALTGSHHEVVAGVLALTAAALGAVGSTLATRSRSEEERSAAARNITVADAARAFQTIVAPFASPEDTLRAFQTLARQRDNVVADAPMTSVFLIRILRKRVVPFSESRGAPPVGPM
jgi:hypothetical protein